MASGYSGNSLATRIAQDIEDIPVDEVKDLFIAGCICSVPELVNHIGQFSNLEKLNVGNCKLKSLIGFPAFPRLIKLDIRDNDLSDGELDHLRVCPSLIELIVCANPISDLRSLVVLNDLVHLRKLNIVGCPINNRENVRERVFEMLGHIIYLNGSDRYEVDDPDERVSSDDDGLMTMDVDQQGSEDEGDLGDGESRQKRKKQRIDDEDND